MCFVPRRQTIAFRLPYPVLHRNEEPNYCKMAEYADTENIFMTTQYAVTKPRLPNQTALCMLAFLIPIAGLIIALIYKGKDDPATQNTGNTLLMWTLIGFGTGVLLLPIVWIGLFGWLMLAPKTPTPAVVLSSGLIGLMKV